jgi:tRNA threonylcarbamoyladenosine biosynthesis protein TsaB
VNLLAIETSTEFLSLAVCVDGAIRGLHVPAGQRHAELILDSIDTLCTGAGLELGDLHAIAYGEGPGSFTGLRIGCSVVQGLALARSLKVLGVGTLLALAEQSMEERVIACIDARMGEVYHAAYLRSAAGWQEIHPPGLFHPNAVPVPAGGGWIGCGNAFAVHGEALLGRLAGSVCSARADLAPGAEAVLRLARARLERGEGAEAASAVPVYVRNKVALKMGER